MLDAMDRKSVAVAAGALLMSVAALVFIATGTTVGTDDAVDRLDDQTGSADVLCSAGDPSPAALAAANARVDALADYLHAHGIDHQTWTNNGRHYIDWDRQNPSAQAAVEAFEEAAGDEAGALPIDVDGYESGC